MPRWVSSSVEDPNSYFIMGPAPVGVKGETPANAATAATVHEPRHLRTRPTRVDDIAHQRAHPSLSPPQGGAEISSNVPHPRANANAKPKPGPRPKKELVEKQALAKVAKRLDLPMRGPKAKVKGPKTNHQIGPDPVSEKPPTLCKQCKKLIITNGKNGARHARTFACKQVSQGWEVRGNTPGEQSIKCGYCSEERLLGLRNLAKHVKNEHADEFAADEAARSVSEVVPNEEAGSSAPRAYDPVRDV